MSGSAMPNTRAISVIIPTIGRWQSIAKILDDLVCAAAEADLEVEVLVVGDGIDQQILERKLPQIRDARVVLRTLGLPVRSGVAVARNAGLALASAPTTVFLDDDVRLTALWPKALRAILEAGWTCATGPVTSDDDSLLSRAREDRYRRRYETLATGDFVSFFAGGNSVISRDVLRDVDGFPDVPVGSDSVMLARIAHAGHVCRFAADFRVTHTHDRGWGVALGAAWRSGHTATPAAMHTEAASLRRALPTAGTIGLVNLLFLIAKYGGLAISRGRRSR